MALTEAQRAFIEERKAQTLLMKTEATEGVDILKTQAPEGTETDKRITFLEAEIVKHESNEEQFLRILAAPDMSNVDVGDSVEEGPVLPHKFKSFEHFAIDLMNAGRNGANASPELKEWRNAVADANQKATITVGNAEVMGTLIPHGFSTEILDRQKQVNPILSRAMFIPMETPKLDIPYLESFDESGTNNAVYGAVVWYWTGEEAQFTGSNAESGAVELVLRTCTGLARVTGTMMKHSPRSIEAILRTAFDYGMSRMINRVAIRGTGAGQPLGVLNSATSRIEVAKETNQTADTFIYDNIGTMLARLYSPDDGIGDGVWYANKTVLPQILKLSLAVGTGGSGVFLTNNQIQPRPGLSLLGLPLEFSSQMSAVGDAGDVGLFDWRQYLVGMPAGEGEGAEFAFSIHLYFDYNHTAFRFIFEMDGQPWWPDNFRPEYGDSQAPFVTLAERA